MVDIEPGIYKLGTSVTFMSGTKKYMNMHRPTNYYNNCADCHHISYMENGWVHVGPSEVCKW